jgi:hypothetical protein
MWKMFAFGGALAYAAAGTWPVIAAASQGQAVSWLVLGVGVIGPELVGLAATILVMLATRLPEMLQPIAEQA